MVRGSRKREREREREKPLVCSQLLQLTSMACPSSRSNVTTHTHETHCENLSQDTPGPADAPSDTLSLDSWLAKTLEYSLSAITTVRTTFYLMRTITCPIKAHHPRVLNTMAAAVEREKKVPSDRKRQHSSELLQPPKGPGIQHFFMFVGRSSTDLSLSNLCGCICM